MATAYTTLLGLALPVQGELAGTWGDTVNAYITQYLDAAVAGAQVISGSQTAVTLSKTTDAALSQAGAGATGSSQYQIISCTGNPAGLLTITAPAASKVYLILNNTSTSQSVKIVGTGPTTGVTVAAARNALVAWNGSDFELVATTDAATLSGVLAAVNGGTGQSSYTTGDILYASSSTALAKLADVATGNVLLSGGVNVAPSYGKVGLTTHVSGTLPIANGGTNATTASGARTSLGATTLGANIFTITNPSAITFPRFNADNTISALNAADFRTAIGAGTGGGSVTSVAVSGGTTGITVSGSPITSSGTITLAGTLVAANGGTGQSSYTVGDLLFASTTSALSKLADVATGNVLLSGGVGVAPSYGKVGLTTHVSGTLGVANGGTGATTFTAGTYLKGNGTSAIATQSGIPAGDITSGTLGVARGGTGATTLTGVVIGNGTSAFTVKTNPSGAFVGTTDTQTLTNKTVTNLIFDGSYTEEVFALGTSGSIALNPANGTIQTCALAGNPTFTDSLSAGQSLVLRLNNGASYTVTWPTTTWVTAGGNAAPTLTAADTLVFWKISTTLYGAYVGSFA